MIAADGVAFETAQAEALIDDVARREASDKGWSEEEENDFRREEEKNLYSAVLDSLLTGGKAVAAEQFLFSAPDDIWDGEAHAETRGLFERDIRAEIAEAVAANGGQPLAIAERRKLINEAAADMAPAVATAADDTLVGGIGDDTLGGVSIPAPMLPGGLPIQDIDRKIMSAPVKSFGGDLRNWAW